MSRTLERIDISEIVSYRRRVGRASLAGAVYGLFIVGIPGLRAFLNGDDRSGLMFLSAGAMIVVLSLHLRAGSVFAATLLGPALVLGIILGFRVLVVRLPGMPWSEGVKIATLAFLFFGPVAHFLGRGIVAVFHFKPSRLGEAFTSLDFGSRQSDWNAGATGSQRPERAMIRIPVLKIVSETMVLGGAGALFCDALLRAFSQYRFEFLSLAGLIILILGVNFNLHVGRLAMKQSRERLERDTRPMVLLLLRSLGDERLNVRARMSWPKVLSLSFPYIPLARVISEQLISLGPVITIGDREYFFNLTIAQMLKEQTVRLDPVLGFTSERESFAPSRRTRGCASGKTWQQKIENWMGDSRSVVMVMGRIKCLGWKFSRMVELNLLDKGMLVFPPVRASELRLHWEKFCGQISDMSLLRSIHELELKRAMLLVFRGNDVPLLITADTRDEWAYEAAFKVATVIIQRDGCAMGQFANLRSQSAEGRR